ncbi:putative transposase, partial [Pseudomonas amygdali pv. sesami]
FTVLPSLSRMVPHLSALRVTTCNRNGLDLQSSRFSTGIVCVYSNQQTGIICE